MQIKTITCHDVYNHGASLQAYALQTHLESLGHTVEIIDYKPDYLSRHYRLWSVDNPVYDRFIVKQLYLLAKLPGRLVALKRKKLFDDFTSIYLHKTQRCYHNNKELKENPPYADVYIAGSDQIWNTRFQNGRDAAFYLDFAPKMSFRVAYAASFATEDVVDEYKSFVRKMLQNFNAVSIREKCSLPLLASLGRADGVAVCDPVFLISKAQWENILPKQHEQEKYILVYDSENSVAIKNITRRIAKEKNLKIFNISASRIDYADKDFWISSPLDFVRLIRDAQYVVSNSFHASAFSLIFQRDFCVVNRSEAINERMKSLLKSYHISERLVTQYADYLLESIDYSEINQIMMKDIDFSKNFLKTQI